MEAARPLSLIVRRGTTTCNAPVVWKLTTWVVLQASIMRQSAIQRRSCFLMKAVIARRSGRMRGSLTSFTSTRLRHIWALTATSLHWQTWIRLNDMLELTGTGTHWHTLNFIKYALE